MRSVTSVTSNKDEIVEIIHIFKLSLLKFIHIKYVPEFEVEYIVIQFHVRL